MDDRNFQAIIICSNFDEVKRLKGRFPAHWRIVTEGSTLMGYRADAIFVTPGVSTDTSWFDCVARLRLWKSTSPVVRIEVLDAEA
ncbi:hypothetical protein MAL1_00229 [Bacteriophage DSS3_MAL1]|nr:hypothetical protein MAL1_00229 [Bacteriophage DSS3_MAL1]